MFLPNEILIPKVVEFVNMGKTVTLPLRGFSMRPYLEDDRDKALLAAPPRELHIGDVVLAEISQWHYALHRIVAIDGESITMYGDGNFSPEHITRKNVLAIALGFYRKGNDELDSVSSWQYRFYWRTWVKLRPIRKYLLFLWLLNEHPMGAVHKVAKTIKRLIK